MDVNSIAVAAAVDVVVAVAAEVVAAAVVVAQIRSVTTCTPGV